MRKILNQFYVFCAFLSGLFLVGMVLLVLAQIITRFFDAHIPSSDDVSGYMVAWSTFLGLAYTMNKNKHIRVDVLFNFLSVRSKWFMEILVNIWGSILIGLLFYYVVFIVQEAYNYGDVTSGYIAFPLWLIQLPFLFGIFALWVSVTDRFFTNLNPRIFEEHHIKNSKDKKSSFSETIT